MRIAIVTGGHEYLLPRLVELDALGEVARRIDAAAVVPPCRWAPPGSAYHTFLFDEPADRERRIALFLEYVTDVVPRDGTAVVLLPFESAVAAADADERVRFFAARAQAALGAEIRAWRLQLGDVPQAVLRRLAGIERDAPPPPGPPVTAVSLDRVAKDLAGLDAVHGNYSHAVLRLGERIVAREAVLAGAGRANLAAQLLDVNQMWVRAELGPDQVLEQLRPGGQLHELLARPLSVEAVTAATVTSLVEAVVGVLDDAGSAVAGTRRAAGGR